MRRMFVAAMCCLATSALISAGGTAVAGHGSLQAYGLTQDQALIRFQTDKPQKAETVGPVTGLATGETLVGMDFRPANGELVGLSSGSKLYTIDPATAVATFKSTLSVPLDGTAFGVDFNPTVDRLRIVSNTRQNLRVNVDTGATTVDGTLAYAAGDPNFEEIPSVVGAAYTNNDNDGMAAVPTATTLYDIDSSLDTLVTQNPPNSGTLNTVGDLKEDTNRFVGFDIYSRVENGSTVANTAFVTLSNPGKSTLYTIDLATAKTHKEGPFTKSLTLIDIAIPQAQS